MNKKIVRKVDEHMRERIIANVGRFIDEGYSDIVIKISSDGFTIVPTKVKFACREEKVINSHPSVKRNKNEARDDASPNQDVNVSGDVE